MKKFGLFVWILACVLGTIGCAGEPDPTEEATQQVLNESEKHMVVTFTLPEPTPELYAKIDEQLNEDPGVVAIGTDQSSGKVIVTFRPDATSATDVFSLLMAIEPKISMESLRTVEDGVVEEQK